MADAQANGNGSPSWLKQLWPTIVTAIVVGAISWGSAQSELRALEKRADRVEARVEESMKADAIVSERLARIEANLQFVVEELRRQQAARR